ncbi:Uncharacterised protein [Salmonella enterica subsp. enterica]|nr:Uncharacterised protein [Salmonella enterica subsp. enterica]
MVSLSQPKVWRTVGGTTGKLNRQQRKEKGRRVGEHMSRIRQQRQRAGEYPAHHLKEHKSGSDDKGEKQATSIIIFRQV